MTIISLINSWPPLRGVAAAGAPAGASAGARRTPKRLLTVTDPTGLTSKQTITVTVTSPPAPPTTGTTTSVAPPHLLVLGKPSVSANKVTLRLSCTSARLSLSPNETKTITLTLNRRGRSLLARFRKLPVTIAVAVDTAVAETARATLHPRRKPPHHHP